MPPAMPGLLASLFDRLRRITSSGRFVPEIDGLRFFAIASVVLFHVNAYVRSKNPDGFAASALHSALNPLFHQGQYGVHLFFIISGMILSLPFAEWRLFGGRPVTYPRYLLRRVTRLEPPYLINLAVCFILYYVIAHPELFTQGLPHLLASATYTHNAIYGGLSKVNYVTWSLEIEVQFYLIAPLLAFVFLIRRTALRRGVLITAIIGAAILAASLPVRKGLPGLTLGHHLHFFLTGLLLTDLYLVSRFAARPKLWLWDVAGTLAWIAIPTTLMAGPVGEQLLAPLALVAYVAAFRGPIWNRIARNPWLTTIGGMCYTIYLFHPPLKSTLGLVVLRLVPAHGGPGFWGELGTLAQIALMCTGILIISAGLFLLIEKPFMRRDWPARFAGWLRRRFLIEDPPVPMAQRDPDSTH
jgi:peptidoglycan/LPS O-acetylase OafA/YrhL